MAEEAIPLRELLEARIKALEQRGEQWVIAAERALKLQAVEYERRLGQLNHAHDQAREKERDFVSRETFDHAFQRIQALEQHRANLDGRLSATAGVLFGASILINLAITIAGHFLK